MNCSETDGEYGIISKKVTDEVVWWRIQNGNLSGYEMNPEESTNGGGE